MAIKQSPQSLGIAQANRFTLQCDIELQVRMICDGTSHRHLPAASLAREAGNSNLVLRDVERSIEFVNCDGSVGRRQGNILKAHLSLYRLTIRKAGGMNVERSSSRTPQVGSENARHLKINGTPRRKIGCSSSPERYAPLHANRGARPSDFHGLQDDNGA